jgi:EpsI family protein
MDPENYMKSRPRSRFPWHMVGTLVLLATTLAASKLTAHRRSDALTQPLDSIGPVIQGFVGSENPPLTSGVLRELKCSSYLARTYVKDGVHADLFIAYYAEQRAGESMHSPKHCLPGSGWEIWDYGSTDIRASGHSFKVNKYSIENSGERRLVLYWYQSKGRIIASEYVGKLLLARDALLQNSTAGSIVRIIVPDQPGALEYARGLASELIPQVRHSFGE